MDTFLERIAKAMERQADAAEVRNKMLAKQLGSEAPPATSSGADKPSTKPTGSGSEAAGGTPDAETADAKKARLAQERAKKKETADLNKFKKTIVSIAKASKLSDGNKQLVSMIQSFGDGNYEISDEIPAEEREAFIEEVTAKFDELIAENQSAADII